MTAAKIIDKFGGQSALARLLGTRQSTIQHWYNNRIPAKWQKTILDLAKEQEISLKAEDFFGDPSIPGASHPGTIQIGDMRIPCAVLDDQESTRVLSEHGVTTAMRSRSGASKRHKKKAQEEGRAPLPVFMASNNLKPFISDELRDGLTNPIKYRIGSRLAQGFKAELLPAICDVWLKARDAGVLNSQQLRKCKQAEILMRGLAHIGIIALVDEATGYQEIRDRLALQKILDKFLTDEWAKWTKTFPDDYYKELFRLKNIPYPPTSTNKPQYVGHWTNDVVYSRLVPGVVKALKKKNPVMPAGYRRRRHHQYLTKDYGHPALKEHLSNVIFLMKTCSSWQDFKTRLDMASPKYGDTMLLPFREKKHQ